MNTTPRLSSLLEYALIVAIIAMMTGAFCVVMVAFDLHSMRVEFASANVEWRRETFRRVDAVLWKMDTALELGAAARLDLGNALTKIRAQVKQASDTTAAATQKQTQQATKVVTQAINATREAVQAVAGEPVTDEPEQAPAERGPAVINVPPPVVVKEPPPAAPRVEVLERPRKRRHWYSFLWPGNWRP